MSTLALLMEVVVLEDGLRLSIHLVRRRISVLMLTVALGQALTLVEQELSLPKVQVIHSVRCLFKTTVRLTVQTHHTLIS